MQILINLVLATVLLFEYFLGYRYYLIERGDRDRARRYFSAYFAVSLALSVWLAAFDADPDGLNFKAWISLTLIFLARYAFVSSKLDK